MKQLHTLLLSVIIFSSCTNVYHIYESEFVNEKQYDKLVKMYLKNPADTSVSNRVIYAYQAILNGQLSNIETLKVSNTLQSQEALIYAYDALQDFYNGASVINRLVSPGNVFNDRQLAVQRAAENWYNYGNNLLAANTWQSGREAFSVFQKINRWVPEYRNTRNLIADAREMGTIDAVIQPLRNEGFFRASAYTAAMDFFSGQLVNDLAGGYNNGEPYRVYNASEAGYHNIAADWMVEPVVTSFTIDPVRYNRVTRTVSREIEVGIDSAKQPIHKTISAELYINEASVCSNTQMEARIADLVQRQPVDRCFFNESITLREVTATYSGDRRALSTEDWAMINNRNRLTIDERWLQETMLEKIYPQMLAYLKGKMRW
jgi:hypothetical protein